MTSFGNQLNLQFLLEVTLLHNLFQVLPLHNQIEVESLSSGIYKYRYVHVCKNYIADFVKCLLTCLKLICRWCQLANHCESV